MSATDPYRTPTADLAGKTMSSGRGGVSANMLDSLRKTKPWVLLVGILLFISAAFTVLAALAVLAGGGLGLGQAGGIGGIGGMGAGVMIGMGLVYLIAALTYVFLGLYLVKYSRAIGRALESRSSLDVEDALAAQGSFWKLSGILALIFIAIMVIAMLVGGFGAFMAF